MDLLQLWIEGYKARGEACKQGALAGSILLAVLAATIKEGGLPWAIIAAGFLAGTVACSALAFLFAGNSVTYAAHRLSREKVEEVDLTTLQKHGSFLMLLANIFGFLEIPLLLFGLLFTVVTLIVVWLH